MVLFRGITSVGDSKHSQKQKGFVTSPTIGLPLPHFGSTAPAAADYLSVISLVNMQASVYIATHASAHQSRLVLVHKNLQLCI